VQLLLRPLQVEGQEQQSGSDPTLAGQERDEPAQHFPAQLLTAQREEEDGEAQRKRGEKDQH